MWFFSIIVIDFKLRLSGTDINYLTVNNSASPPGRVSMTGTENVVDTILWYFIRDVNETRETRDSKKFLGIEH